MQKNRKNKGKGKSSGMLVTLEPNAGGVDIGAEEIYVAVPPDRDENPVRSFGSFTRDLYELADWLKKCRVQSVAMEIDKRLLDTAVSDSGRARLHSVSGQRSTRRNVPGRKSDVSDCQWIQYLHSVGLLKASFLPPAEICAIRSLWRHRESLVQMASQHTMHMQALSQMNVQIHHVLSEVTSVSGLAMLDAILAGERDPVILAGLCNWRVRSPREVIEGFGGRLPSWASLYLAPVTARISLVPEDDRRSGPRVEETAGRIAAFRRLCRPAAAANENCIYQRASNDPAFNLPVELYRISGVDLTDIPGISANTAQTILSEVGPNVSRFRNASAFASWLGLSPEKQISGGKTLQTKTRKVKNRAAIALRLGASCLYHAKNYLGEFFRSMKFRLGTATSRYRHSPQIGPDRIPHASHERAILGRHPCEI
jgi:transposase